MIDLQYTKTVATITLNRPDKCNALNATLVSRFMQALDAVSHETDIKLLVIKGAGKHFCAGLDFDWIKAGKKLGDHGYAHSLQQCFEVLHHYPIPILSQVQGAVFGGGVGLLACSDIVIASSDTILCFPEVKLGLVPGLVSPYVVPIIGLSQARCLFLTGERFDAVVARNLGLVHHISDEPSATLDVVVQMVTQHQREALINNKSLLRHFTCGRKKQTDILKSALITAASTLI